ncbi:MAG TPA: PASTA domain-containing protein [Solirubrobacteraceae bacterium]|nr:PASTA domain-containing protein [Solirubrobacteraceae bacterium]
MTEPRQVPERVIHRGRTSHPASGSGSQPVADYIGRAAGEAAKEVRRAGQRPGLERSFGHPEDVIGLVVAQEPAAGGELARNGMVTLYVAAPGAEAPSANEHGAREDGDGATVTEPPDLVPVEQSEMLSAAHSPQLRRRKPGRALRAPGAVAPAAQPAVAGRAERESERAASDEEQPEPEATRGLPEEGFSEEEALIIQAEDVLSGRAESPSWRSPLRPSSAQPGAIQLVRSWVEKRRVVSGLVAVALALWLIPGITAALRGKQPEPPRRSAPASSAVQSSPPAVRHEQAGAPRPETTTRRRGSGPQRRSHEQASGARGSGAARQGKGVGEAREGPAVSQSGEGAPAMGARVAPAGQSGGGPFSP